LLTTSAQASPSQLRLERDPPAGATPIPAAHISVAASAGAPEGARRLVDGKATTAWCIADKDSRHVRLTFTFTKPEWLESIGIVPIDAKDFRTAKTHGRVRIVDLLIDGRRFVVDLPDFVEAVRLENIVRLQEKPLGDCDEDDWCLSPDERVRSRSEHFLRFGARVLASRVDVTFSQSYRGSSPLTCASEIRFYRSHLTNPHSP
jgi:hypothetical protein